MAFCDVTALMLSCASQLEEAGADGADSDSKSTEAERETSHPSRRLTKGGTG